ncbi:unknown [Prevotella sp. CAG:924]|nr:unknown [Prevotella sp. CAG:924]
MVADALLLGGVDGERGLKGGGQGGEALGIVLHAFGGEAGIVGEGVEMGEEIVELQLGHLEEIAVAETSVDGGGVAHPDDVVDGAGDGVFLEMAEVLGGGHIMAPAVLRLEIDVERVVVHLEHDGLEDSFLHHARIVLWPPGDEILTVGGGEAGGIVVDLEEQPPGAVGGMEHEGMIHELVLAPLTVVGAAELADVLPFLTVGDIGHMQAVARAG